MHLVGTTMVLNTYEVSVSGSDTLTIRVIRAGNRLRTRTVAPWGEELREYPARAPTVIFDEGVAHHYFILEALLETYGAEARIHAVVPLAEMEESQTRSDVGAETIEVGGERVETTRIRLSSGGESRVAWFDGSGAPGAGGVGGPGLRSPASPLNMKPVERVRVYVDWTAALQCEAAGATRYGPRDSARSLKQQGDSGEKSADLAGNGSTARRSGRTGPVGPAHRGPGLGPIFPDATGGARDRAAEQPAHSGDPQRCHRGELEPQLGLRRPVALGFAELQHPVAGGG